MQPLRDDNDNNNARRSEAQREGTWPSAARNHQVVARSVRLIAWRVDRNRLPGQAGQRCCTSSSGRVARGVCSGLKVSRRARLGQAGQIRPRAGAASERCPLWRWLPRGSRVHTRWNRGLVHGNNLMNFHVATEDQQLTSVETSEAAP